MSRSIVFANRSLYVQRYKSRAKEFLLKRCQVQLPREPNQHAGHKIYKLMDLDLDSSEEIHETWLAHASRPGLLAELSTLPTPLSMELLDLQES